MRNYTTLSTFDERLIKGQSMEFKVAAFFLSQHLLTHWLPLPKEGNYSQLQNDLKVNNSIIEVKSKTGKPFEGVHDFPYSTVLVDTKKRFAAKIAKPDFYIVASQMAFDAKNGLGAVVVPVATTREFWTERNIYDFETGKTQLCFEVKNEFCESLEWLAGILRYSHLSM
jgi:hypothetical protein